MLKRFDRLFRAQGSTHRTSVRGTGIEITKVQFGVQGEMTRGTAINTPILQKNWDLVIRPSAINTPMLHLWRGSRKLIILYMYFFSLFCLKFHLFICLKTRTEILPELVRTPTHPSLKPVKDITLVTDLTIFCPDLTFIHPIYSIQMIFSTSSLVFISLDDPRSKIGSREREEVERFI